MIRNRGIAFKLTFFILTSSVVIFIVIFGYNYLFSRKIIIEKIEENANILAVATVSRIETILYAVEKVPSQIANSLEYSYYNKTNLLDLLRSVVEGNPEIYGATIAFEPYTFDRGLLYFAPYFYKSGGEIKFTYLGSEAYQYFYWDWYRLPKTIGSPVWSEPYYDVGGGSIVMSTYSAPFYREIEGRRKFAGIVTADVSLSWLQDIVSSIKIEETGYGFLISKKGTIVTHPEKELIMNETIFSIAEAQKNEKLRKIGQNMIAGRRGFVSFTNKITGQKMWIFYAPLPSNGWSLGILFAQKELMGDIIKLNSIVLGLAIAGFLFLFVVVFFIAGSITKPLRVLVRATKEIAEGKLDFRVPEVKSGDEVGKLSESFIYMGRALKKYIQELTETTAVKERIESELKIAHDIQMSIVPKEFPFFADKTEFDIYAILEPAKEVGGDFYDFFLIDDNHLCFVIADIAGKGVPAALFMAVTKTLIKDAAKEIKDPAKILDKINKEFTQSRDTAIFLTVFCGILDIRSGEVIYANGGHNPPLIIRSEKDIEFLRKSSSSVVGIAENTVYENDKFTLEYGDIIYAYTDGVIEAFNEKGEMFSEERLKDVIKRGEWTNSRQLAEKTLQRLKVFSRKIPQSDDITILVLKYLKKAEDEWIRKEKGRILVKNDFSEVHKIRKAVEKFGEENNLPQESIFDLNVALEEIIVNIISYAYEGGGRRWIKVDLSMEGRELSVKVEDDGKFFDPTKITEPDLSQPLEERTIGGWGMHLVRSVMDEMEYKRDKNKNVLTLRKKIERRQKNK